MSRNQMQWFLNNKTKPNKKPTQIINLSNKWSYTANYMSFFNKQTNELLENFQGFLFINILYYCAYD